MADPAPMPGMNLRGAMGYLYQECRDEEVLLEGGAGCVAGSTVLDGNPYQTVAELAMRHLSCWVYTIHGRRLASPPYLKGYADIYRVTLECGKYVDVMLDHLFMTPEGWVRLRDLDLSALLATSDHAPYGAFRPASTSASCRARSREGAPSYSGRAVGYRAHCLRDDRPCGGPAPFGAADAQASPPSRGGACGCNRSNLPADALVSTPTGNRSCRSSSLPSTLGCLPPSGQISGTESQIAQSQRGYPLGGKFQTAAPSRSTTSLGYSTRPEFPGDHPIHFASASPDKVVWVHVASIVKIATNQPYYDLEVERDHHYLAHGIYHHNSGKTIGAMKKLVDACYKYPGSRHLLCRQTRESITESTLVTLESIIGMTHPEVVRVKREQRHSYRLNGSEIVLGGLNEPSKCYGTAWGLIVLEEAIEAYEPAWDLFGRAARDPRLLAEGEAKAFPYHQRIAITNPGSPEHWLNKRATPCDDKLRIDRTPEGYRRLYNFNTGPQKGQMRRLVAWQEDNPRFFNVQMRAVMIKNSAGEQELVPAWGYNKEGAKYIDTLDKMHGAEKMWMRWGMWRQQTGIVYPMYDSLIHVIDDFDPPASWPQILCYDPGWGRTGIVWLAIDPAGNFYVIDDIEEGGKTVSQHVAEIHKRNRAGGRNVLKYLGDPNEMFSTRAQGQSCARQAREALPEGLRFIPWPKDSGEAFDAGVDAIRTLLNAAVKQTESEPHLYICKRATGTQSNFSTWSMKKDAKTGEQRSGADKYEENNDHCADGVRGGLQSGILQREHKKQMEEMQ